MEKYGTAKTYYFDEGNIFSYWTKAQSILVILLNHLIEIGFFQQVLFKYTNITLRSNMSNKNYVQQFNPQKELCYFSPF